MIKLTETFIKVYFTDHWLSVLVYVAMRLDYNTSRLDSGYNLMTTDFVAHMTKCFDILDTQTDKCSLNDRWCISEWDFVNVCACLCYFTSLIYCILDVIQYVPNNKSFNMRKSKNKPDCFIFIMLDRLCMHYSMTPQWRWTSNNVSLRNCTWVLSYAEYAPAWRKLSGALWRVVSDFRQ